MVAKQIVQMLLCLGADPADIGVTSPYSQQVRLLQNAVSLLGKTSSARQLQEKAMISCTDDECKHMDERLKASRQVTVMTIDKFQGQDKSIMVISMVRSNSQGHTGALLSDCRRINVALTRAKHKLVLIGNSEVLCRVPMLKQAYAEIGRLGVTYDMNDRDS